MCVNAKLARLSRTDQCTEQYAWSCHVEEMLVAMKLSGQHMASDASRWWVQTGQVHASCYFQRVVLVACHVKTVLVDCSTVLVNING